MHATHPPSEPKITVVSESLQVRVDSVVPNASPQTQPGASVDLNSGPGTEPKHTRQHTQEDSRMPNVDDEHAPKGP